MRYEIHFVPERNPFWIYVKGTLGTDHQILRRGGGGSFCQLHDVFSFIKAVLDFFGGYCPTPQHPNTPTNQKSNGPSLRCYQVLQLFM